MTYKGSKTPIVFAKYGSFNLTKFGESGNNRNLKIFAQRGFKTIPGGSSDPYSFTIWNKYEHQIFHYADSTLPAVKKFVIFYPDLVLMSDSTAINFYERLFTAKFSLDTVQLVGYDKVIKEADSLAQEDSLYWKNTSWIQQTVIAEFTNPAGGANAPIDTFLFMDTTQVQYVNRDSANFIESCPDALEKVELAASERLEVFNFPNPFNPETAIRYSIPQKMAGQKFSLKIYNVRGQVLRTLSKGKVGKRGIASRKVAWRGMDDYGKTLGSGIYFYRLKVGDLVRRGSMVMVK